MTDIINNIENDKQDIKNQLGDLPDVVPVAKLFNENIQPVKVVDVVEQKEFDGSDNVFILNSATYGVLGTNKLGDSASTTSTYAVIPNNNQFVEYFGQSTFIDSGSSTGTLNTTNETYVLTSLEILQSDVIAKLREPITNAKFLTHEDLEDDDDNGMILGYLELGTTLFSDDNVDLYLSNDGGSTWESADIGTTHTFVSSGTTNELKYRITNLSSGTITIDKPLYIQINL